eukprot:m.6117 g.6117  ORF g.6117 m.6117 type:complete len:93 (+) comp5129_c0_seq1:98-376(+)
MSYDVQSSLLCSQECSIVIYFAALDFSATHTINFENSGWHARYNGFDMLDSTHCMYVRASLRHCRTPEPIAASLLLAFDSPADCGRGIVHVE